MKNPRFLIIILVLGTGLLLMNWYTTRQAADRKEASEKDKPAATQPDRSATKPAASQLAPTPPQPPPVTPATPTATPPVTPVTPPAGDTGKAKWSDNAMAKGEDVSIGSVAYDDGYMLALRIDPRGAAVYSASLAEDFVTATDKQLWEKDPAEYEKLRQADPKKYKGHYDVLTPVSHEKIDTLSFATRELKLCVGESEKPSIELNLDSLYWKPAGPPVITDDSQSVSFVYKLGREVADVEQDMFQIIKTYTVRKGDYSIGMSLAFTNLSTEKLRVELDQSGPTGLRREGVREDARKIVYGWFDPEDEKVNVKVEKKSSGKILGMFGSDWLELNDRQYLSRRSDSDEPMLWIAATNKFFSSIMYIKPTEKDALNSPDWEAKFYYAEVEERKDSRTFLTGVEIPELELAPGSGPKQMDFDIYIGPKKQSVFSNDKDAHFKEEYKDLEYVGTIDFGGCFCTFNWLTLGMMWLLQKFSIIAMGNWGVAIILLVVLVRVVMHPLTKKSQISMMKMQKLAPQMQKLKEKYADDKEALQKEMMKFYKEQGASPILGCLPMLLQMPIWIALWTGINSAFELRHAAFLPFWLTDLAAPDALITWSNSLPLIGNNFNLLPLLMAFGMYLQTKLNPSMAGAAASPEQQKSQKMMKIMLPGMMLVFLYQAPSGVTLYIMSSMFGSVLEQFIIRKHIREKDEAAAVTETTVRMPGKAARDSRPKKPKGPFWSKQG